MQAIYKKRIIDLAIFNRSNQYLAPGIEKIFQISYDRGLNLPDTDQAILDRLAGKTWFVINKPVQYRCPKVLVCLFQAATVIAQDLSFGAGQACETNWLKFNKLVHNRCLDDWLLYFCICFKVPAGCHISSAAAVCALLLGVSPLDLAIIEGDLLQR